MSSFTGQSLRAVNTPTLFLWPKLKEGIQNERNNTDVDGRCMHGLGRVAAATAVRHMLANEDN